MVLQIHHKDNVAVALQDLARGSSIVMNHVSCKLVDEIPAKHKFFLNDMEVGDEVIMYGVLVGKIQQDVQKGSRLTQQNIRHAAAPYGYRGVVPQWNPPDVSKYADRTFHGYHRSDGKVGTANYWLFIPTVFCENRNLDVIREALNNELGYAVTHQYKQYAHQLAEAYKSGGNVSIINFSQKSEADGEKRLLKNVDGIKFLNHQGGCGGTREDAALLSKLLAAYADHPNVGGITMLSLGCQNLQVADFLKDLKERNPYFDKPLYILEQQQLLSEELLIGNAIQKTFEGLIQINLLERKPAGLHHLCVGVKCGGSDGFSGISANPSVGHCADLLVALGAKVLLAEFPELCGVEQQLVDRSVNEKIAIRFIQLMKDYEEAAHRIGSGFDRNPSPGNIRDGIITDAMKSAGAAKKAGTSPVVEVLDYTEPALKPGLNLVCTPGNDVESTTGKVASGATLILFTTGLGTPTGNPICPTIKLSSNSRLAHNMKDIIDMDTGCVIEGKKTIAQMGEEILEYCIQVASGDVVPKAVQLNQDDFIPWKRGISL